MLNISFLAHTKVELYVITICIAVNGKNPAVTLTLIQQCPISNSSKLFLYFAMYLNFMRYGSFSVTD